MLAAIKNQYLSKLVSEFLHAHPPKYRMRKFIDLVESPLADIETYGEPLEREGSFSAKDRGYMARAIIRGVYKQSFKGIPFNLYIYVLNHERMGALALDNPEGEITVKFIQMIDEKYPEAEDAFYAVLDAISVNEKRDPKAVHFVFGDNLSDINQIPPTPWMIVHRLMHTWFQNFRIEMPIWQIVKKSNTGLRLVDILTFNSAVQDNLEIGEDTPEIATQYLLTGDIGLRNLDQFDEQTVRAIHQAVDEMKDQIDSRIAAAAGKSYYI